MIYLVLGGSGSGKSEYAENLAVELHDTAGKNSKLFYLAHMYPYIVDGTGEKRMDDETRKRIERHRTMRKSKGFETRELFCDMKNELALLENDTVLLSECMSNLLANEMYLPEGNLAEGICEELLFNIIVNPIIKKSKEVAAYVVVTNEIYLDKEMDAETVKYVKALGYINKCLVKYSKQAYEVVCGIPLALK